jgi:hypothetical protein
MAGADSARGHGNKQDSNKAREKDFFCHEEQRIFDAR